MYEIKTDQSAPVNIFAGEYPVVTSVGALKGGTEVSRLTPLIQTADGITAVTIDGIGELVGIAADDSINGEVVMYLTGEYFSEALSLPENVTAEILKPAFRKLGIFLK